jgi:hypothetical protein
MLASLRVARTTGGMVWSSGKGFEAQPKRNSTAVAIHALTIAGAKVDLSIHPNGRPRFETSPERTFRFTPV